VLIKEIKKGFDMRDLFDKEFQQEMDDFFDYIDYEVLGREKPEPETELIHEVDGVVVTEPLEDVLEREHLEMKAELHHGI
tara:strand:+ start:485 stop:724 length:240 start_codon:yes stop_codon:yes gene_type:complete